MKEGVWECQPRVCVGHNFKQDREESLCGQAKYMKL